MVNRTSTQIASSKLIAGAIRSLKEDVPEIFHNDKYDDPSVYLISRDEPFNFLGAFAELKTGVADKNIKIESRKKVLFNLG